MNPKEGKKIGAAVAWSSVTEIVAKLTSPLVNMVLARLLAPEAFGAVATITMVISFVEIFTDAGFQKYIVQHAFSSREELDKSTNVAFWTNFAVSCLMCLAIFFFRHPIARLVGSPALGDSISIASVLIPLAAFSSIQMARYRRDMDFKTLCFVRMGSLLIPITVTIPLAVLLRNYWALLAGNFALHLFNAVVLTVKSKWRPRLYYSFSRLKEMFSFSAWTLSESLSIWLTSYVGVFIVGAGLNDYYLGLYKITMSTVNSYMAIITASVTPVLFSALSRYQNDETAFRKTYYRFQRYVAMLVLPMGVGMWIFSDLVTRVLLGEQWMEASGFIGLWSLISAVMVVFSHFSSEVYRSKGRPRISFGIQMLQVACIVPALLIAMDYGFQALYITRSLVRLQMAVTSMIVMQKVFRFSVAQTMQNVFPAIVCTTIMGVVGFLLKPLVEGVLWQLAVIGLCVAVYFTLLLLMFPKIRKELLSSDAACKIRGRFAKKARSAE